MEMLYSRYHQFEEAPVWTVHDGGQYGVQHYPHSAADIHTELTGLARYFSTVSQPAQDFLQSKPLIRCAANHRSGIQTHIKRRSVAPASWEKLRPVITELYVGRGKRLDEVRTIMEKRHGLMATEQMYKKKFKIWGLRKYAPRQQKEGSRRHQEDLSKDTSDRSSEGDQETPDSNQVTPDNGNRSSELTNDKNIGDGSGIPHINPQGNLDDLPIHRFLQATQQYYLWFFGQPSHSVDFEYTLTASNVFDNILSGRSSLSSNPSEASALFNKAGKNLPKLLQHPHLRLVSHLISHCSSSDAWHGHDKVRRVFLNYFVIITRQYCPLGQQHPLFKIGSLLLVEDSLAQARPQTTQLLLEVTREQFPASSDISLSIQSATSTDYIRLGDYDNAEILLEQIISQASTPTATNSEPLRHAKYILGRVYGLQGKLNQAERLWLEVMQLCVDAEEATGQRDFPNHMMSCRRLGELYEEKGELADAEHYLRMAMQRSIKIYGEEDPITMRCLKSLERNLMKRGKHEEIAKLQEEYGRVNDSLREYQLEGCMLPPKL